MENSGDSVKPGPIKHQTTLQTRVADLDTQRHITSRTYESFCLEGRHRLLEANGFPIPEMLTNEIRMMPMNSYVKFYQQQMPGAILIIDTVAYPRKDGTIEWNQEVKQQDGKLAAVIQTKTKSLKSNSPIDLLPICKDKFEVLYGKISKFSKSCEQVKAKYSMQYSDRDAFGQYPPAALWKVFEEGRWLFTAKVGLTLETIVKLDTTSFYMGGIFEYFGMPEGGQPLTIKVWIERVEKIRYYFRQDVFAGQKRVMSLRDEQLIVSLSQARPKRATPEFTKWLGNYIEFRDSE